MPAGWKPITVQKIIQIQSNLEYCILTACDWRRWDGNAIYLFIYFLFFSKFQLTFLMLNKPVVTANMQRCLTVPNLLMGFRQRRVSVCVREGGVIFSQCKLLISSSDVFGLSCQLTLNWHCREGKKEIIFKKTLSNHDTFKTQKSLFAIHHSYQLWQLPH